MSAQAIMGVVKAITPLASNTPIVTRRYSFGTISYVVLEIEYTLRCNGQVRTWTAPSAISKKPDPIPNIAPLAIIWLIDWPVAPTILPIRTITAPVRKKYRRPKRSESLPATVTRMAPPRFQEMVIQVYRASGPKSALMKLNIEGGINNENR